MLNFEFLQETANSLHKYTCLKLAPNSSSGGMNQLPHPNSHTLLYHICFSFLLPLLHIYTKLHTDNFGTVGI